MALTLMGSNTWFWLEGVFGAKPQRFSQAKAEP